MKVLEENTDAIDMYLHHLPDQLTYSVTYKIASSDDMELLMSSRLEMLKVVNDLDYTYEYSDEIVKSSREYFEKGDHTTVLAMDGKRVIGCASICYMYIMPTFDHPTGKRAHLMNVYTMKEWQRQGIARKMVSMLIDEAWKRGATEISLDATEEGRPLYERLGFTESTEGMVLTRTENQPY
jgi:GNAT superfamily N-acetyltransferase